MAVTAFDLKQTILEDTCQDYELYYCFKSAQELGVVTSLTALQLLNVSFNKLSNVRGIQQLACLQHLDISHNQINSIEGISALTSLTCLIAGSNKIQDTSPLQSLQLLELVALHKNDIHKASAVLQLSTLRSLRHLTLVSNPVCNQEHWQPATIAALSKLQALDSVTVTQAHRAAAQPHALTWRQVLETGDASYSSAGPSSTAGSSGATGGSRQVSSPGRLVAQQSAALGTGSEQSRNNQGVKDVYAMLPNISMPILKPSTLVRKPEQHQPSSMYGWSRGSPATIVHKQRYQGAEFAAAAVEVRSDGSAAIQWPEGSMAAALDVESSMNGAYRLLAMYRSVTGAAASFDSNGGFVQYPTGSLMLVWNKKDGIGTCYGPDGAITHSFNSRKKRLGLKQDVQQQLDQHYSILFKANTYELQLFYDCEGCSIGLSLMHGAMLSEDAAARAKAAAAAPKPSNKPYDTAAEGQDTQAMLAKARALLAADYGISATIQPTSRPERDTAGSPTQAAQPATGAAQPVDSSDQDEDGQALLARARALMAATKASS